MASRKVNPIPATNKDYGDSPLGIIKALRDQVIQDIHIHTIEVGRLNRNLTDTSAKLSRAKEKEIEIERAIELLEGDDNERSKS